MMAVYTTGLTTPLNSVLMISLEQLSPGTLAANCLVGLIFIFSSSVGTSTPNNNHGVTGDPESRVARQRFLLHQYQCQWWRRRRRRFSPPPVPVEEEERGGEAAAFSPGRAATRAPEQRYTRSRETPLIIFLFCFFTQPNLGPNSTQTQLNTTSMNPSRATHVTRATQSGPIELHPLAPVLSIQ